ncbi:MAG: GntR family transcriptional regulator [Oscillospiraceae bacterium]|nr:GntR family transcriptional regulator [Oscillospiraceae bacterium]MCL2278065.1 GntR family transcriptional regulator [Oscillospiraceae bacterium]
MTWQFSPDRPIYLQLQEQIKLMIVSGRHPPGGKMPAVRDLAENAAVNPNTVQRALTELEREGLLHSQRTSGRYVTEDKTVIEKTKSELASEIVEAFLKKMEAIGYSVKETADIIAGEAEVSSNGNT